MPTLISPGASVTVTDESFGSGSGPGTVPLIILATSSNKLTASGDAFAVGTLPQNAGKLYLLSSQREILQTFGMPKFNEIGGSALHGYPLNEYGLFAAHSYLGIANRAYCVRADIDLDQLTPSDTAPSAPPVSGTAWVNPANVGFGVYKYDSAAGTFVKQKVYMYTGKLVNNLPDSSIEPDLSLYEYTVVVGKRTYINDIIFPTNNTGGNVRENRLFRLADGGVWVSVAGRHVATAPAIDVQYSTVWPNVRQYAARLTQVAAAYNPLTVYSFNARVYNLPGQTVTSVFICTATSVVGGSVVYPTANYTWVPETLGEGDLWINPDEIALSVGFFNEDTSTFVYNPIPSFNNTKEANTFYGNAPAEGSLFAEYSTDLMLNAEHAIKMRNGSKITTFTRTSTAAITSGTVGIFRINGGTAIGLVNASNNATIATLINSSTSGYGAMGINALVTPAPASQLVIQNVNGGEIDIRFSSSNSVTTIGFTMSTPFYGVTNTGKALAVDKIGETYSASNWEPISYTHAKTAPVGEMEDGTLWYNPGFDVDLFINSTTGTSTSWKPLALASITLYKQTTQPKVATVKSIWLDTDQLAEYPVLYRCTTENTVSPLAHAKWTKIDTSDQSSPKGIIFADARATYSVVAGNGINNGGSNNVNLDSDAPKPLAYPNDMLLWNTRASGRVVKEWKVAYYTGPTESPIYVDSTGLPENSDRWVLKSGTNINGSLTTGLKAVKKVVTQVMAAVIVNNEAIRSEFVFYNLIAAPGFPELIDEMVLLNTDKKELAFIIGDTPFNLKADSTSLTTWATNGNNAASNGDDGLVTRSEYLGIYYPSGLATSLEGLEVVVPPSHMMLRNMAFNDQVAYQWLAPAGLQRGVVTNAVSVGYVDDEGEYVPTALNQGQRDILYINDINPIKMDPNSGVVVWGQKTRSPIDTSAMSRINVARLINYLRYRLDQIVQPFFFEPNDAKTRASVKTIIDSLLSELISLRGLTDFIVVCDSSNNYGSRVDNNELWIDIAIVPTKAIEFIYIPVRIKATGQI